MLRATRLRSALVCVKACGFVVVMTGHREQLTNAANHSAVFSVVRRSDLCHFIPILGGRRRNGTMQEVLILRGLLGRGAGI
jgi:hypothetical protein